MAGKAPSLAIMRAVKIRNLLREVMMVLMRFCGDVAATGIVDVADTALENEDLGRQRRRGSQPTYLIFKTASWAHRSHIKSD